MHIARTETGVRISTDAQHWGRASRIMRWVLYALEIAIVVLVALSVADKVRGTGPLDLISGQDAFTSQQGRLFWEHVRSCGQCAFWNGDVRGGAPAAADPMGDTFYPSSAAATYLFGTVQGAKVALAVSIALGGLATWWLALELGLGAVARIVAGCMGATASHTSGKMEQGLVVVVTSIAAASLVLPALIRIYRLPTWRSAALLGITLGLTALAGQGYVQVGLLMLIPLSLILLWRNPNPARAIASRMVVAAIVALLIAMPFLLPFARMYSMFDKSVVDVTFSNMQPARYLALNLVISDREFLTSTALGKAGFAGWYINYLGWIPVGLALIGAYLLWRRKPTVALFLVLFAISAIFVGGGAPFKWMTSSRAPLAIQDFGYTVRIPDFIANLAAPPLIGLAAVTIDAAVRWRPARKQRPSTGNPLLGRLTPLSPVLIWIVLGIVLFFALRDMRAVARSWISTEAVAPEIAEGFVASLETESLAWVSPPDNDSKLQLIGLLHGLKLADSWRSTSFDHRELPSPYLAMRQQGVLPELQVIGEWNGYLVSKRDDGNPYATVVGGGSCTANGEGGHLDLTCSLSNSGRLVVQENDFGNWTAEVNGLPVPVVREGQWIAVDLPEGVSSVAFRYRPIEAIAGIALGIAGYIVAIALFFIPDDMISRLRSRRNPARAVRSS